MKRKIEISQQGFWLQAELLKGGQVVGSMWGYGCPEFIHLMQGHMEQDHRRQGHMSSMIKELQDRWPEAELSFHQLTNEGMNFVSDVFPEAIVRVKTNKGFVKMTIIEYISRIAN